MSLPATKDTSQYLDNREHDDLFEAKRVMEVGNDNQTFFDYGDRTDGQRVYIGTAARGVATSADGWVVKKFSYDDLNRITSIQPAIGSWDNRASLTY